MFFFQRIINFLFQPLFDRLPRQEIADAIFRSLQQRLRLFFTGHGNIRIFQHDARQTRQPFFRIFRVQVGKRVIMAARQQKTFRADEARIHARKDGDLPSEFRFALGAGLRITTPQPPPDIFHCLIIPPELHAPGFPRSSSDGSGWRRENAPRCESVLSIRFSFYLR